MVFSRLLLGTQLFLDRFSTLLLRPSRISNQQRLHHVVGLAVYAVKAAHRIDAIFCDETLRQGCINVVPVYKMEQAIFSLSNFTVFLIAFHHVHDGQYLQNTISPLYRFLCDQGHDVQGENSVKREREPGETIGYQPSLMEP